MNAPSSLPPAFRLKVTAGPLKGARFPLTETVTIGRSSQVEIFVADGGVSRRHAKVLPLPDGGHVLVDLGSANGTLVDGQPVSEHRLLLGQSFTVGGTVFEYEEAIATQPVAPDRGTYAVGATGTAVERTVVSMPSEDTAFARHSRETAQEMPAVADAPGPAEAPRTSWKRIEARAPEGLPYGGDLLSDVILYRNLRLRHARGDAIPPQVKATFVALEKRLQAPALERDDPNRSREFARFAVSFPAHLRFGKNEDTGFPVEVRDFGVGGCKVHGPGLLLDLDELTWLAIDLVSQHGPRTIVFTARVVWSQAGEMGLVFSGAPGWARHSGSTEAEDTLLVERERSSAMARTRPVKLRLASNGNEPER